jgi:hypothetical protein
LVTTIADTGVYAIFLILMLPHRLDKVPASIAVDLATMMETQIQILAVVKVIANECGVC